MIGREGTDWADLLCYNPDMDLPKIELHPAYKVFNSADDVSENAEELIMFFEVAESNAAVKEYQKRIRAKQRAYILRYDHFARGYAPLDPTHQALIFPND